MTVKNKILIVDDEQAILKILSIKLTLSDYEVITALDGQQALDLIYSTRPDIILLDVIMPEMDGFQLLERLRTFSDRPVIVFSARPENAQKALKMGANDFVPKPFDVNDLVIRINKLISARG
jgi:DNA-binding response OmpR family regulator